MILSHQTPSVVALAARLRVPLEWCLNDRYDSASARVTAICPLPCIPSLSRRDRRTISTGRSVTPDLSTTRATMLRARTPSTAASFACPSSRRSTPGTLSLRATRSQEAVRHPPLLVLFAFCLGLRASPRRVECRGTLGHAVARRAYCVHSHSRRNDVNTGLSSTLFTRLPHLFTTSYILSGQAPLNLGVCC